MEERMKQLITLIFATIILLNNPVNAWIMIIESIDNRSTDDITGEISYRNKDTVSFSVNVGRKLELGVEGPTPEDPERIIKDNDSFHLPETDYILIVIRGIHHYILLGKNDDTPGLWEHIRRSEHSINCSRHFSPLNSDSTIQIRIINSSVPDKPPIILVYQSSHERDFHY